MSHVSCFAPVEDADSTVLILGSMPGKASLAAGQYYAHPRNAFWPVMGKVIGFSPDLPYEKRLQTLRSAGIALWDALASCDRKSSLDAHIEADSLILNDFQTFFRQHPNITRVLFNGAKAEQCFVKYVLPTLKANSLHYQRLPSTSPANAGISYDKKLLAWQVEIQLQCPANKFV
jgi:TDG/mug DNA glycosylase family protein